MISPPRINEKASWEQVKSEENHALNSLLMENSMKTLTPRSAWISHNFPYTNVHELQTFLKNKLSTCPTNLCKKECLEAINGNSSTAQLDLTRKEHMEYSAQATFADLQTNEAKKTGVKH